MDEALRLLDVLEDQVKTSDQITERDGAIVAITAVRTDIQSGGSKVDGLTDLITALTCVTDNFTSFTSADANKIAQATFNIIGAVGLVVSGPYGPLVAAGCGLVSSTLALFGGGKTTLADQLEVIIREAIEDFKNEAVYEATIGALKDITALISQLMGMARYNGGVVGPNEMSFLADAQIALVANDILGTLEGQLSMHKTSTDETKCKRLAQYTFFYSNISLQKTILLNIHCGLLRRNNMESVHAAVNNYLTQQMKSDDTKVLGFMSELPTPKGIFYWLLFRYLHLELNVLQRQTLVGYRKHLGLEPMKGKLIVLNGTGYPNRYTYTPGNHASYDSERRNVFRWDEDSSCYGDYLFRLVNMGEGKSAIFSVYYGEYMYCGSSTVDRDARWVWFWREGGYSDNDEAMWQVEGDFENCTIRNVLYGEYFYTSSRCWDSDRYYNYTDPQGNASHWRIQEFSYADTLNLNNVLNRT